jgi:NAD(P)-dependent dehydrogenase (short-subunit alcohol dehydrogenase family)
MESKERSGAATPVPALVVGGTGMLAGTVRELAGRGHPVAVLARREERLRQLAESAPGPVLTVRADWADDGEMRAALGAARAELGAFGLAVLWVHSPHRERAQQAVAELLADQALVVDVLGSASRDPGGLVPEVPQAFRRDGLRYRRALLGFTGEGSRTRWLTNAEISAGVAAAVDGSGPAHVVGRLTPWSDHP